MTTYTCGGQQNPEKVSELKGAAKNFFKASKELGVDLGHEGKRLKDTTKEKGSIALEKIIEFMDKNPRIAGVIGTGGLIAGTKLLGLAADIAAGTTSFVNASHAVALDLGDKIDVAATAFTGYAATAGVAGTGIVVGAIGAYGVNRLYKHAKDNRWALKARVAIRKQAQKKPELHKFLVAANHKIYNGVQIAVRELGGR